VQNADQRRVGVPGDCLFHAAPEVAVPDDGQPQRRLAVVILLMIHDDCLSK